MNLDFLKRIRRNHGLEHATIALAHSRMARPGVLAGNATQWGYLVYGEVSTEVLSQAASEALERLKAGEGELAISPNCGTNLVVAAALAGLACTWALGKERRWSKMPGVITAALVAFLAARPIGYQVQKHLTTSGDVARLKIEEVDRMGVGGLVVHRVRTASKG